MREAAFASAMVQALKAHLEHGSAIRPPAGGELLCEWFVELSTARSWHGNGPNPITFEAIIDFITLYRWPLQQRHIHVLRQMDRAYVDHFHTSRQKRADGVKSLPPIAAGQISPAMFDAMFG